MNEYLYECDDCGQVIVDRDTIHTNSMGMDVHEWCCDICEGEGHNDY